MSSFTTATKTTTTPRDSNEVSVMGKASLYKLVMTPVIFVSFLLSLALVDLHYSLQRLRSHSHSRDSRLSSWLHRLLYRPAPGRKDGDGFYHSKQKKLAKMEMAEAFEIRGVVVAVLVGLCAAAGWGAWALGSWAWNAGVGDGKVQT